MSKSYFSHKLNDVFTPRNNEHEEVLNNSFGNKTSNADEKRESSNSSSSKRKSKSRSDSLRRKSSVAADIIKPEHDPDEISFLTNNNNTFNMLNSIPNQIPNQRYTNAGDARLEIVLKILDLDNLIHILNSNRLTFNDMLFLSKEDLMEMNIPLGPRNRILKFSDSYRAYGKDYSVEEIILFFIKNKSFVFGAKFFETLPQVTNFNSNNFYENNVQSTANFNEGNLSQNGNQNNLPLSPDFAKAKKIEQTRNRDKAININTDSGSNISLANYVSNQANQANKNHSNSPTPNTPPVKSTKPQQITDKKYSASLKVSDNRSDSEEKACQTGNMLHRQTKSSYNIVPVGGVSLNTEEEVAEKESKKSSQMNEVEINMDNFSYNSATNPLNKTENTNFSYNTMKIKPAPDKNKIGFRKNNVIEKDFQTLTGEVEKFIKNYKLQKEKSDDRKTRLKCIIDKSKKSRSKSKDYHLHHHHSPSDNLLDYGSSKYFSNNKTIAMNTMNLKSSNNKYNSNFDVNEDDLKVEEERNLNEEINKLLNRINSASQLSLDSHSLQQLNRIKSLANLNLAKNNGKIKYVDLNMINQVIKLIVYIYIHICILSF